MKLVSVYRCKDAPEILYELLEERLQEPDTNISHRSLPTWRKHLAFMRRRPYLAWYLVRLDREHAGTVYLDRVGNLGIVLFPEFRGQGIGAMAIAELMQRHKRPSYFANINVLNERSKALFLELGFKLLQQTYELRNEP